MKLRIEKPIYGGAGLSRLDGKAIFVPFTLPEELVEARVTQDRGSYANAELVNILEPSPHRTKPVCPWFGQCGGCHYQHIDYSQQLEIKSQILRETLERAHINDIPEIDILHADPFRYRNRIRLHVDRATSRLCYKRPSSHQNLAVDACPIAAPILEDSLKAIQAAAPTWQLGRHFTEIELFTNSAKDSVLITLWTSGASLPVSHKFQELWPQMRAQNPNITGAAVFSADKVKQPIEALAKVGEQSLVYTAAGREYRVSLGSFFQTNRFLIDALANLVTDRPSDTLAWDLYAGVGLFSVALASRFEKIIAVESAPASIRDLHHNLQGKQNRIIASRTLDFLRRFHPGKESTPDFVVVDPPRAGLGKEVTALLVDVRPAHITYVSCDPATLSRDLKSLLDSGYHLTSMHMVDLFPQTFHLESVAALSLK